MQAEKLVHKSLTSLRTIKAGKVRLEMVVVFILLFLRTWPK